MSRTLPSLAALAFCVFGHIAVRAQTPQTQPRITQADLTYIGAFRLPLNFSEAESYGYGGNGLTLLGPNRLALVGHDHQQRVGEVSIPTPGNAATVDGLPTATNLVLPRDVLAGRIGDVGVSGQKIGGLLPLSDGVIVSAYVYYDAGTEQVLSHFKVGANGLVSGPYQVGNVQAGFVSGFMTPIPSEWQRLLGGTALTGNCCLSIIRRTSLGPSATVFDPANLSKQTSAKRVLGYPLDHPTLGGCTSVGREYNCAALIRGMVFPAGTRSVLFFGRAGTTYCYGDGVSRENPGRDQCYDPSDNTKGEHGYPYVSKVWAYDATDLLAVKNGSKQPWDVRPYSTWTLTLPFSSSSADFAPVMGKILGGAAYDPTTKRIYVSAWYQDGVQPIIHVFSLPGGSAPVPAASPTPALTPPPAS